MSDCVFCKIMAGELPCKKVYEDELVFAIHDIAPKAPVHILIFPREHVSGSAAIRAEHGALLARMVETATRIAEGKGIADGHTLVINEGSKFQSVPHLHIHLLGGEGFDPLTA